MYAMNHIVMIDSQDSVSLHYHIHPGASYPPNVWSTNILVIWVSDDVAQSLSYTFSLLFKPHQEHPWFPSETPGWSGRLWLLWRHLVPSDGELHAVYRPGDGSRCIAEHLGAPATHLWASGGTSNNSRAFWEKQHLLWERCWCAWNS
jgi:hypothetical protein